MNGKRKLNLSWVSKIRSTPVITLVSLPWFDVQNVRFSLTLRTDFGRNCKGGEIENCQRWARKYLLKWQPKQFQHIVWPFFFNSKNLAWWTPYYVEQVLVGKWYRRSRRPIQWMRWEKLCVLNVVGVRGLQDLYLFNLALLGKMTWRLIKKFDGLVCRILWAKCFPQGDFLTARLGGNLGYTWSSIYAS